MESTPSGKGYFTGKEKVCLSLSQIETHEIKEFGVCSQDMWGERGVIQSQMRTMPFSLYCGYIFDNNTSVLHVEKQNDLPAVFSFIESGEYLVEIRKLNQKLDVAAHTMIKVTFDLEHWTKSPKKNTPTAYPNLIPMTPPNGFSTAIPHKVTTHFKSRLPVYSITNGQPKPTPKWSCQMKPAAG